MGLAAGTRLGGYEIIALIGSGGMGEVYRAKDTRLKREVAIKVLPDAFVNDAERLARFQREAELLATLNHPNIAQIYGLEDRALVLELVEGPTLADRIAQSPLPVDEALVIAKQIAEALEAAHERGIIHRDLKPANIKLTPEGKVKVLDFGLAKAADPASRSGLHASGLSQSPTITSPAMTMGGVILGTAAYMSPEQAKGMPADHRSDIFAFGVIFFEMFSGRRPFQGETAPELLASIIVREPDVKSLPRNLHPRVTELIDRCLAKNPRRRWQAVGDLLIELDKIIAAPSSTSTHNSQRKSRWRHAAVIAAVAIVAGGAGAIIQSRRHSPVRSEMSRLTILLGQERLGLSGRHMLSISNDGRLLAYIADQQIFLRPLSEAVAKPIPGTQKNGGLSAPAFSPDGRYIAFWAAQDRTLKRVAVTGGTPVPICQTSPPFGISWSGDYIYYAQGVGTPRPGILRVPAGGGNPEVVVTPKDDEIMQGPQLLPGGESLLFTVTTPGGTWDAARIVVQSLRSGERKTLVENGMDGRYLPTGHIAYAAGSSLFAVPIDLAGLTAIGAPVSLETNVSRTATTGAAHFSVSATGTLVYLEGTIEEPSGRLITRRRDGTDARPIVDDEDTYPRYPRVSPDGTRLAVTLGPGNGGNLWIFDLNRRSRPLRLTTQGHNVLPIWSRDGRRIVFRSVRPTGLTLSSIAADGTETQPTEIKLDLGNIDRGNLFPHDFTTDGRLLFTIANAGTRQDLMLASITHSSALTPLFNSEAAETAGRFSPDGRFIAYVSDSTGAAEVWVRPFPGPGPPVRVSEGGGREPLWSLNGRELYFQSGPALMSAAVRTTSSGVEVSTPTRLFSGGFATYQPIVPRSYDVLPDGRFVMIQLDAADIRETIAVTLNWFDEVARRVKRN